MIDIVVSARSILKSVKEVSSNGPGVANRKEEYERERNVALRAAARGIHIFLSRFKSEWSYRRAIVPSLSCVRKGSHTANTRVENGLYRGECVRSVLVPIGSTEGISGSQVSRINLISRRRMRGR